MDRKKKRQLVYGVGVNDIIGGRNLRSYSIWLGMIKRCYSDIWIESHPTYEKCKVCDEWLTFSIFNKWFENPTNGYMNGYCLDKDILRKGNKYYSPDTCCFVPKEINTIFKDSKSRRGLYPAGVIKHKNMYVAQTTIKSERLYLGSFSTVKSAFIAYCSAREKYIKQLAQEYYDRGEITHRVYDALMNYQIDITD